MLLGVFVLLIMLAIAMVVAVIGLICAGILVVCGIVSGAVFIGIVRRRFSAGLRALHYQIVTVLMIPWGILACCICDSVSNTQLALHHILLLGAMAGIVVGIGIAFLLDLFVRFLFRRTSDAKAEVQSKTEARH